MCKCTPVRPSSHSSVIRIIIIIVAVSSILIAFVALHHWKVHYDRPEAVSCPRSQDVNPSMTIVLLLLCADRSRETDGLRE